MADESGSGGGPPSTDDMLNALAAEMGVSKQPKPVVEAEPVTASPEAAVQPEPDGSDTTDATEVEMPASTPVVESTPAPSLDLSGAGAAAVLGMGSEDITADELPELDYDDDDDLLDEDLIAARQRSQRNTMVVLGIVGVVLLGIGVFLSSLASTRMKELDDAKVIVDSPIELLTLYDVHEKDIKTFKIKEHNKAERAKVPIYGNLRIESEPQFADVYVDCIPTDARCNNVGSKESPKWDPHWVRDEETKEQRCVQDTDCRQCRKLQEEEIKRIDAGEFDPGESIVDRNTNQLCHVHGTKCQQGKCFLPIRTATTMQSLFIGTLGGLEETRRYAVRVQKPGWLPESYEVSSKDWTQQAIPGRDDSDRVFVRRFELKPDANAPPEIKARVDAYLQKKAEAEAAMMKEMESWQGGQ